MVVKTRGGSRKIFGGGAGPSLFGRQQRLSEITIEPITSTSSRTELPWKKFWGPGQDLGGGCAPWPQRRTATGQNTSITQYCAQWLLKVIECRWFLYTDGKGLCNIMLVNKNNLGRIFLRFGDTVTSLLRIANFLNITLIKPHRSICRNDVLVKPYVSKSRALRLFVILRRLDTKPSCDGHVDLYSATASYSDALYRVGQKSDTHYVRNVFILTYHLH